MHKLGLVLASLLLMLVAGLLAFKAEATPMLPSIPQSSPVEAVACGGPGPYCPPGRTRVCGPAGCWCAPCGGYYRPYWGPGPYYRPWRWRYRPERIEAAH
jgi:hypothetical protein